MVWLDYYPEYWVKDGWRFDAELISSVGLNVVRSAEY
mgnify:CR=1 FL=1